MIPITSSTSLSIEKTAKLLQNLVDLDVDLPDHISAAVDNILEAQQTFVKEIDSYLHQSRNYYDEDNIEAVTTIVQTCPEFLATKKYGRLPCRRAACMASSSGYQYLILFADIGLRYDIGSKDSRGGLILHSDNDQYNALHFIRDPKVLDVLQKLNPPLFFTEDVKRYNLLSYAAQEHALNLVKFFCKLDPSCLCQINRYDELPIHSAIESGYRIESMEIVQYLLQQTVSYSISNETVGGLFTKMPDRDDDDGLTLDVLVDEWGREETWDCIERALSTSSNLDKLPILHQTIRHAPQYCSEVINRFPSSVYVRDDSNNNRLPLHVALETGMKFSLELNYLINTSKEYLREADPVTKWPPFVLAAMGTSCDLRIIYSLLHKNPEHVEMWCGDSGYKYASNENCKRRKMNE